jgi:transcriptional regulator with XRE-family HTH domain
VDVRAVRRKLKLSQAQFAAKFGFSPATLRNWEQGRSRPDTPNRVLLAVIAARRSSSPAAAPPYAAPVTDIADALRRSLDAVPKPPCSEGSGSSSRKRQKRRPKE